VRAGQAPSASEGSRDARLAHSTSRQTAGAACERRGCGGARHARGGEHDPARKREERLGQAAHVLVGHRRENQHEWRSIREVSGKRPCPGGIVGAVEQDGRVSRNAL